MKVTVGSGLVPVTTTDLDIGPPRPVQSNVNVFVPTFAIVFDVVPLVDCVPVHAPEAVQDVTPVDDHVNVVDDPTIPVVGFAAKVSVGAGYVTVTGTLLDATSPPGPVHVIPKLPSALTGTDSVPETGLTPDQFPVAEQLVAFVELHVSVVFVPTNTEVGLAAIVANGSG